MPPNRQGSGIQLIGHFRRLVPECSEALQGVAEGAVAPVDSAKPSEQADDLFVLVDIDRLGGRDLGKPRHRHNVAGKDHHEAGAR